MGTRDLLQLMSITGGASNHPQERHDYHDPKSAEQKQQAVPPHRDLHMTLSKTSFVHPSMCAVDLVKSDSWMEKLGKMFFAAAGVQLCLDM